MKEIILCVFSGIGCIVLQYFFPIVETISFRKNRGTKPFKVYEAHNEARDKDLLEDIVQSLLRSDLYYYEGRDIIRCSQAIEKVCQHGFEKRKHLYVLLGLSDLPDISMIKVSLESILTHQKKVEVTVYISRYPVQMHLHMTDDKVWYSPYIRLINYPVTYCYKKIRAKDNDSDNSFYNNLKVYYQKSLGFAFQRYDLNNQNSIDEVMKMLNQNIV